MEWIELNTGNDQLPEIKDDSVLAHFENGSIETVHIKDMFGEITAGINENGIQLYTRWYIDHNPKVTHWMELPEAPQ